MAPRASSMLPSVGRTTLFEFWKKTLLEMVKNLFLISLQQVMHRGFFRQAEDVGHAGFLRSMLNTKPPPDDVSALCFVVHQCYNLQQALPSRLNYGFKYFLSPGIDCEGESALVPYSR